MLLPLALLLSAVILSTTGSPIQDNEGLINKEVFPGIGEYFFAPVPRNWTEAYQICNVYNGHLAVIDSEAEKAVLRTMMAQNGVASIHLGFHDRHSEGDYYTVTDRAIESSQWAVGYPTGGPEYNCGVLTAAGLQDSDCSVKLTTICEVHHSAAEDYVLIPGHGFYKYHAEESTWSEAWKTCKSEGAYLHILNSQEEQDALYQKYQYSSVWVGVHRLHANNNREFHTIFDLPFEGTGFTDWYDLNQPYESYLLRPYVYSFVNQRLATQTATYTYPFICEIDLSS